MTGRIPASICHPRRDDCGKAVTIKHPTMPSPGDTWLDPTAAAVFVPDGPVPPMINDVPLAPATPPSDMAGWDKMVLAPSQPNGLPPFPKTRKKPAAGAVIVEPDGRVWLCEPTNHYGGYQRTFPKGTGGAGWSFEATAAREVFEETGLLVEIGPFLIDSDRSLSVTRFFLARRIGGCPSTMGWETQAVWLVPMAQLPTYAPAGYDATVVDAVIYRSRSAAFPPTEPRSTSD